MTWPWSKRVVRHCRDCNGLFSLPRKLARTGRGKWVALCPDCLRWHI